MKHSFLQAVVVSILLYGCTTLTITKRWEKKNAAINIEQVLEATPHKKSSCTATYHPIQKLLFYKDAFGINKKKTL